MPNISKELSSKFSNMELLCAMLVVFIHFHLDPNKGTSIWYVNTILVKAIASIAVPFFFFASGYFLAGRSGEQGWWISALKKRSVTLLIPYVFWCCAWWVFFNIALPFLSNLINGEFILKNIYPPSFGCMLSVLGFNPHANPGTPALWYVRALCMFVMISPLLLKLANRGEGGCVLFASYLILCPSSALIKVHPDFFLLRFFFSLEGLFYFTLGMYMRISGGFMAKKWQSTVVHLIGVFFLMTYLLLSYADIAYRYYVVAIAIPFWIYTVWYIMPRVVLPRCLTDCTFPLFAMHQLFIAIVAIATHGRLGKSACEVSIASTIFLFVIVLGVCFVVSWFTHKFKLSSLILWGGR